MTARRVFLAALFHETHGFVDDRTTERDFDRRRGEAVLARAGDGSVVDGILSVAREEGWRVAAGPDWAGGASGPVEHAAFEAYRDALLADLRAAVAEGPLDGIVLALHGAMTTTETDDAEGDLLAAVRAIPGARDVPLFGAFDLHATFTGAMARHADGLVGYREHPHTDGRDTGVRAARLLARALRDGRRPRIAWRRVPVLWPPTGTGTADSPMRDLEAAAREAEAADPRVLAANVVAGFAFADARDAGVSVSFVHEEGADLSALDRLADVAWALRERGQPAERDLDEAVRDADARPREGGGPFLLVEPADNIGGGAPGDCTDVLRALLRHGARGAGVALADPVSVAALDGVPLGGAARLALGGRGWSGDAGPVELDVTLVARGDRDGFEVEDRRSHWVASAGSWIRTGPSAVVRHAGLTILLNTRKTAPMDLGQWRSVGVAPESLRVAVIKAAVAHRRAWEPIASGSATVRSRGPCASDLSAVPYRRLARPAFPLDPEGRGAARPGAGGVARDARAPGAATASGR